MGDDEAGAHRVGANVILAVVQGQGPREVYDRALGRIVGGQRIVRIHAGHRGVIDDHAAADLSHQRNGDLAAIEGAVEIDIDHPFPFRDIRVRGFTEAADPSIIEQDVDLPELVDCRVEQVLNLRKIGYVGLREVGRLISFLEAEIENPLDFLPAFDPSTADHDATAFGDDFRRGRLTDTRSRHAGYDGNLAFESAHRKPPCA